jgi:aminotransferase
MRPRPNRLERLPEQYFTALLARVAAAAAEEGEPVVDVGRGNPDVPPPAHVVERLAEAAREPAAHGYAPFKGLPELKEAIAERYSSVYGVVLDPEREVASVPGTKTAIVELALCLAERGETIVLPDPGYPDYLSGVALAGAKLASLPLDPDAGFAPDFAAAPTENVAAVYLNYPSNPAPRSRPRASSSRRSSTRSAPGRPSSTISPMPTWSSTAAARRAFWRPRALRRRAWRCSPCRRATGWPAGGWAS